MGCKAFAGHTGLAGAVGYRGRDTTDLNRTMGLPEILAILMVVTVCAALFAGYPVALTLGGISLAFAGLGQFFGIMDFGLLGALPQRIFGVMTNDVLLAIPLFIFMGVMLERSRIAEELLSTMAQLFGSRSGGLGISVILVGALLAASTGIVGATAVTMGLIMLPTMLRAGYDPRLAAGSVAAAATLAQIIPPSTVLVVLGDQLNNAYQTAQLSAGIFAPKSVSVGDLFAGALVPGLMLVCLYVLYQVAIAMLWPQSCPPATADLGNGNQVSIGRIVEILLAPALLILAVLGSILGGIATPTEAAAVGAVGATLLSAYKLGERGARSVAFAGLAIVALLALRMISDPRLGRSSSTLHEQLEIGVAMILIAVTIFGTIVAVVSVWRSDVLRAVMAATTQITCMIYLILIGATLFSLVFRGLGGDGWWQRGLGELPGGVAGAIIVVMIAMFLLGFVMDAFEIVFVVVPIVAPALLMMEGVNPVWLGVLMAMNLQISYMHPPLGPTLFYLRGVAPPEITTRHIYVGDLPFVAIQLLALIGFGSCLLLRPHCRACFMAADWMLTTKGSRMKARNLFDLSGRVALVTGASSGLGAHFSKVLAANGASIALIARRAERMAEVKQQIEQTADAPSRSRRMCVIGSEHGAGIRAGGSDVWNRDNTRQQRRNCSCDPRC